MSIKDKVEQILKDLKGKTNLKTQLDKEMYLMNKYPDLYEKYPFLIKKLTKIDKDEENLKFLYLMLDKIEQINKGETTQASVELDLGQQLADKYLKKD